MIKKCFVKTSLKPYMFRSLLYDHPQGSPSYLVHYHISACLLRPVAYSVCGCMCLCECVPDVPICRMSDCSQDVPVCGMSGREQPDIPQTGTSVTHIHTHRQHTATYRISNWTKQTSGEMVMH
jgi:hypothetical protein